MVFVNSNKRSAKVDFPWSICASILWPKFEDETTGIHLAFTGAVKDEIMDLETLACHLIELLARRYPQALAERYKLEADPGLPGAVEVG